MTSYSPHQVREKYKSIAARYDAMEAIPEFLGLSGIRKKLFGKAAGKVLEVAAGTGKNFKAYRQAASRAAGDKHQQRVSSLTAIDVSPEMLHVAERKAARHGMTVEFKIMDTHALEFPDDIFDTVTSSFSTCTFTDPIKAVNEMARVCRPQGRILLLEHGRSKKAWINRWLDNNEAAHAERFGCHWNRDIYRLLSAAGITLLSHRTYFFGIFHAIEARPGK